MNIHNLVVPLISVVVGLTGCATVPQQQIASSAPTAQNASADYSCEPLLDANWGATPPPDIKAAMDKEWQVAVIPVEGVVVYYQRDCGVNIRGPITKQYPRDGANLAALFCIGDKMSDNIFVDPEPDDRGITQYMVNTTLQLVAKIRQSDACITKQIKPVS